MGRPRALCAYARRRSPLGSTAPASASPTRSAPSGRADPAMRLPIRHSRTDAALERDLAHLADGTLDPSRHRSVEQLVARSPELQARLDAQRRAVAATRSLA